VFDLSILEIAGRIVAGLLIGFTIGLTGIGGGVLVLPTLTIFLGVPPTTAVGTASFYALLTKIWAAIEHYRLKTIHFVACAYILMGAAPAAAVTAILVNRFRTQAQDAPESLAAYQYNLRLLIVGSMILAAGMMIHQLICEYRRPAAPENPPPRPLSHRIRMLGIGFGVAIGFLLGSTSIGGGVLIVPLLALLFHLAAERIVGSSIFIALLLTLITSVIYGQSGQVDYTTGLIMAAGSLGGVRAGSRLSVSIPDRLLKAIVTAIIIAAAAGMMMNNAGH
jgi:uncharacterized membrane protein YfcA